MKYVVDPADCRFSLMVDRTLQVHKIQYVICYGYISLDFVSFHSKIILVICLGYMLRLYAEIGASGGFILLWGAIPIYTGLWMQYGSKWKLYGAAIRITLKAIGSWGMLHGGCWRLYGSFKGAMEDVMVQDEAVRD